MTDYLKNTVGALLCLIFTLGVITALIVISTGLSVEARLDLFEEDRAVEWATVVIYLAAFGIGLWYYLTRARGDLLLISATIFALIATLDELSFGERIIGFEAPRVGQTKLDAVHDLASIAKRQLKATTDHHYLLGGFILLVLILIGLWVCRILVRRGWTLRFGPEALFLILGAALLAYAQAIDINLRILPLKELKALYVEEVFELGSGLCVMCFAGLRGLAMRDASLTPSPLPSATGGGRLSPKI
ncbi:hypothetical protein [Litoreibacter roseus]|uniref:Uncharacterized protein n=1 Tax=Litoreibacter roseus TaxID=2601869 RepID=A0A6N6JCP1_9RHOB|nr:hypothetical protein [Litoreibacter roseus]GFE63737.1 hypothetical protein KIN_08110 [Litoreibacter roseus]